MRSAIAAGLLLVASAVPLSAQVSLDFETGAPCFFSQAAPLTTQFSGQGVTFGGNGEILNQCSNFPVGAAHSGTDFVAYNSGTGNPPIETITFSSTQSFFSLYIGSTSSSVFTWYLGNVAVGVSASSYNSNVWTQESFSGNYDSVSIVSGAGVMTLDDLSTLAAVTATPEPASMTLLATGLIGIGTLVRRRRKQQV